MLKGKNILIATILFIIMASVGLWSFVFQDIKTKINNGEHVVLLFSAEWCNYCVKQKPIYQKVKTKFPEIYFYSIGSESNLNKIKRKILSRYYNIKGLPHFVIFKNGEEQMRLRGFQTEEKLMEAFSKWQVVWY